MAPKKPKPYYLKGTIEDTIYEITKTADEFAEWDYMGYTKLEDKHFVFFQLFNDGDLWVKESLLDELTTKYPSCDIEDKIITTIHRITQKPVKYITHFE